jgi:acyl-CoA thioesterase-1
LNVRIFAYVGALLALQAVAGCSDENKAENRSIATPVAVTNSAVAQDSKLILAFGDSLYAGYGLNPGESFPDGLARALTASGAHVTVQNAGVSGDTSAAGLARLAFTLDGLPRKPDLALVNLGGNDMLRGIDPKETRANLTAICEDLKKRGIPIILTGMVAAPNMGRDYADAFNPIYPDLAKRFDAGLYPFFLDGVIGDRALMQADSVHPNAKGIGVIVGKVAPMVAARLGA